MTQIAPLHRHDMADAFARLHRQNARADLADRVTTMACSVALVIMAAAAGYLAHMPTTCPAPAQVVDPE